MQKNETAAIEKSGEEQLNTAAESPEKRYLLKQSQIKRIRSPQIPQKRNR